MDFINDFLTFPFLRNACLAAVLAAIAAGVTGSLVVVRRSTYLAGAVSHSLLAGVGFSLLLTKRFSLPFLPPMAGAVIVAVAVALLLSWLSRTRKFRSDSVLSAVWTGGMALGVTFVALTPGYQEDLMSYLFGSLLLVSVKDLTLMAVMDLGIVITMVFCYNTFLSIAFNEELARLRGVRTGFYEALYHVLAALTIVLLVQVTGIILAVALLTLPAATAGLISKRLNRMMVTSVILGTVLSLVGLVISYIWDLPAGATIVELSIFVYLSTAVCLRKFV